MEKEKITLTEEQAERFIEKLNMGDIMGFDELGKILKEELQIKDSDLSYGIYDILNYCYCANALKVGTECDSQVGDMDFVVAVDNVYSQIKQKLFNCFTNDFNQYF